VVYGWGFHHTYGCCVSGEKLGAKELEKAMRQMDLDGTCCRHQSLTACPNVLPIAWLSKCALTRFLALALYHSIGDGQISLEEFQVWWQENGGELQKLRHLALTIQLSGSDDLLLVAADEATKDRWVNGLRTMLKRTTAKSQKPALR
jgi:hypothetical protein